MTIPPGVAPAIAVRGVAKSFGSVRAVRSASLDVARREIHALVGENGAGKSTLMRIVSGMFVPDAGTIEIDGRGVTGWSTHQAIDAGVGMVHQHFMLVSTLTVAENIVLGREPVRRGMLDRARAERDVADLAGRTGLSIEPSRRVSELSVGEAQRVEILKTLFRGARILLLDEPTAVLSPPEIDDLWRVLRRLRDEGTTIVLITHKLDEVMDVSDAVTVMRQGETVLRTPTQATDPPSLARAMVGRDVGLAGAVLGESARRGATAPAVASPPAGGPAAPRPALTVRDLVVHGARGRRVVNGVSFTVVAGEIFGIAGVEGNGQTELVEALAGLRKPASGSIRLGDRDLAGSSVRARGDAGLSHIPEDRHRRGLVLEYSVADNLILGAHQRFTGRAGVLDRRRIAANAAERVASFDIRPPDPALPARALSGGNQQKIVVAREMARDFSVLIASQPTRGVDVGAIEQIHHRLSEARAAGRAVVLVSAELSEVMALSDRIAVMYKGRLAAIVRRSEASEEILGRFMTGAAGPPQTPGESRRAVDVEGGRP